MVYYQEKIVEQSTTNVLCYWEMKGHVEEQKGLVSRCLPKAQSMLIFNFGAPIYRLGEQVACDAHFFIVPINTTSTVIKQQGDVHLFGVSFTGYGLYQLVQQPLVTNAFSFPQTLKASYELLYNQLQINTAFYDRIGIVKQFIEATMESKTKITLIDRALNILHQTSGKLPIAELVLQLNVSRRHLERQFLKCLGISPKQYAKLVRFNSYIDVLLLNKQVDWMELVEQFNYHDQPHLIHEVKTMAQLSPQALMKRRDTLYHHYSQ